MSTHTYTITHYRLCCDSCGAIGPRGEDEQDSIDDAQVQDWQRVTRWTGLQYVTRDYCQDCYAAWEQEQEETHRRALHAFMAGIPGFGLAEPKGDEVGRTQS